jgi:hypothetical protein
VIKGTTCLALEIPGTKLAFQMTRDLAASRSNTNKHGIYKINITPNIRINYIVIIFLPTVQQPLELSGARRRAIGEAPPGVLECQTKNHLVQRNTGNTCDYMESILPPLNW